MRESLFIKKNLSRWKKYQEEPTEDPDEMAERFVSLLDDLSYAKTFYSFSKVTRFINGLAADIYNRIYRDKKEEVGRFQLFFKYELPLLFRAHHKLLLVTTIFFVFCCLLGVFSSIHDETFVRGVLGDYYVNMTEQNIASGNPFGVYQGDKEFVMFIQIAFNNIWIAFKCFINGIFAGIGTIYILFKNGVMLGVFQHLFFKHNLGFQSILVIWIHGTLEICSIIISGCAGLLLAKSFLFPGAKKRLDSLMNGAKDGIKIMVTLVPVFIVAAFLEGFVTRHTEMPTIISILILLSSLSFIIGYFIIYPNLLYKKGYRLTEDRKVISPSSKI